MCFLFSSSFQFLYAKKPAFLLRASPFPLIIRNQTFLFWAIFSSSAFARCVLSFFLLPLFFSRIIRVAKKKRTNGKAHKTTGRKTIARLGLGLSACLAIDVRKVRSFVGLWAVVFVVATFKSLCSAVEVNELALARRWIFGT